KQKVEKLLEVGANKEEIKKNKNKTQHVESVFKKHAYQKKRNEIANYRSGIMQQKGYKIDVENGKKRYWGEKRWNEWLQNEQKKIEKAKKKKPRTKLKDENEYYLLIFWSDKTSTGYASDDVVQLFKNEYKHVTIESLLQMINFYLRGDEAKGLEIGTAQVSIIHASQVDEYISWQTHVSNTSNLYEDMHNWILVYKGKAKRYKELLLAILTTIRLMYDHTERSDFINLLLDNLLPQINRKMRERLANDIDWRGLS
ncbi:hypothetical protein, partial [Priestia megaterium]|uniref:hypothetical protein n=1 Tax=Priestia megaterium TaxID=1404 RepID=UPI003672E150